MQCFLPSVCVLAIMAYGFLFLVPLVGFVRWFSLLALCVCPVLWVRLLVLSVGSVCWFCLLVLSVNLVLSFGSVSVWFGLPKDANADLPKVFVLTHTTNSTESYEK